MTLGLGIVSLDAFGEVVYCFLIGLEVVTPTSPARLGIKPPRDIRMRMLLRLTGYENEHPWRCDPVA